MINVIAKDKYCSPASRSGIFWINYLCRYMCHRTRYPLCNKFSGMQSEFHSTSPPPSRSQGNPLQTENSRTSLLERPPRRTERTKLPNVLFMDVIQLSRPAWWASKKGVLAVSTHSPRSSVLNKKKVLNFVNILIFPRQDKLSMLPRATAADAGPLLLHWQVGRCICVSDRSSSLLNFLFYFVS